MSAFNDGRSGSPVFLITHEFYPRRGGIATFAEEMARAMVANGHDVEVWAQAAPTGTEERAWPFRLRRMALRGTHDLGCQARMARELWRRRQELRAGTVYLAEPGPMLAMMAPLFLGALRPGRLWLTFHGSEILKFARWPLRRWLTGRLIRRAERVSVLSAYTRGLLLRHFPEAAGRVCVTPGAPRSDFTPGPERVGARGGKVVVLTVGRLHPRKGQMETLRALQALPPEDRARVEYRIVGGQSKGGYEEALRAAAAERPELAVRFLGDLPDERLAEAYAEADVFAMTSAPMARSVEGFGLVYLEAAAHGLPVVAHDVGGAGEALLDEVTGLLVAPGRPEALTAAFERLVGDEALRRKLGDAGRAWAMSKSWRRSAEVFFNPIKKNA